MKKQELIDLGIADDVADKVLALHGKDIEGHKTKIADLQTQYDTANQSLTEANKQIEDFKGMDIEAVKKAATDWEAKAKQAEAEAATKLTDMQFNHALESALTGAKAKNLKAVQALITRDVLKLKEDGTIEGLDEQLTKIKAENDYLFTDAKEPPKIVTGGNNQPVLGDNIMLAAARKAAGLAAESTK